MPVDKDSHGVPTVSRLAHGLPPMLPQDLIGYVPNSAASSSHSRKSAPRPVLHDEKDEETVELDELLEELELEEQEQERLQNKKK